MAPSWAPPHLREWFVALETFYGTNPCGQGAVSRFPRAITEIHHSSSGLGSGQRIGSSVEGVGSRSTPEVRSSG